MKSLLSRWRSRFRAWRRPARMRRIQRLYVKVHGYPLRNFRRPELFVNRRYLEDMLYSGRSVPTKLLRGAISDAPS